MGLDSALWEILLLPWSCLVMYEEGVAESIFFGVWVLSLKPWRGVWYRYTYIQTYIVIYNMHICMHTYICIYIYARVYTGLAHTHTHSMHIILTEFENSGSETQRPHCSLFHFPVPRFPAGWPRENQVYSAHVVRFVSQEKWWILEFL